MKKTQLIFLAFLLIIATFIGYMAFLRKDKPSSNQQPSESPVSAENIYTLDQVAQHNTETSCWQAINGKVYDVTSYIPNHPNADIVDGCGKDATAMYERVRKHQGKGDRMLPGYEIGSLSQSN